MIDQTSDAMKVRSWQTFAVATILLMAVLLVCSTVGGAGRQTPPSALGSYKLELRGALSGSGHANVSAQSVIITALVRDENGNVGNFTAPNLTLAGGRFSGSGTVMGLPVRVSGRVDPPEDPLRNARLVCTFELTSSRFGRGLGIRQ